MFLSASNPSPESSQRLDEVRWRLDSLPTNEPGLALDEIAAGVELMLDGAEWPLDQLVAALREFDESAQAVIRQAAQGFVQSSVLGSARGAVLHAASTRAFRAIALVGRSILQRQRYSEAITSSVAAEMAARLMRAEASHLKWEHLLYGPFDSGLWQQMGSVFLEAEEDGRLMLPVRLRQGRDTETSTYREYLRAVALQCSGLEQMPVEHIDVADRLIQHLLPALHLGAGPVEGARFIVSPMLGGEPRRLIKAVSEGEPAWYFSPLLAERVFAELEVMLGKGVVPGGWAPGLAPKTTLRRVSVTSGARGTTRHRRDAIGVTSWAEKLSAVRGFDSFSQIISGGEAVALMSWDLQDVSVGGLGAVAPVSEYGMPRIGELIAMRSEDAATWRLGLVRRIQRGDITRAFVGVETFALDPRAVKADDGRSPLDVLLCDPLRRGSHLRVAAPAGALRPGASLFVAEGGIIQKLKPLSSVWRGLEFEVRTYIAV